MTDQNTVPDLVDQYLAELRSGLRTVSPSARDEFVNEIAEHIAEGRITLAPDDSEGLRELLDRIGSPVELAKELSGVEEKQKLSVAKRVKRTALVASASLTAIFLIGSVIWWLHYQPILPMPNLSSGPSITSANGKRLPQVDPVSTVAPNVIPVWAMPKGTSTIHITVWVENSGSLPIRVTGITSPFAGWPPFGPAEVGDGQFPRHFSRTFHAFTVAGNQTSAISLAIPMHCTVENGSVVEPTRASITTLFAGVTHQIWVDFAPFDIEFAKSC
ncbi:MAG: hypothetical protein WA580_01375 [Acidimicrobiales bacterium]